MQSLNFSTDTLDQDNTFPMEVAGHKGALVRITACLHKDYQKHGDGILWAMKKSATLKAVYTEKDTEERARLNSTEPLRHGDCVLIEGKAHKVRILGNFSDCAIFDPVEGGAA